MKKAIVFLFCLLSFKLFAQTIDTTAIASHVVIHKDDRLDILGEKQAEINLLAAKLLARTAMGYRLQVLSTNDRELAMRTKTQLLQMFPEQKTYMIFQLPYVKLRFGNFKTKQEAEPYRKQIGRMLEGTSVFYVPERIEVKPGKDSTEVE
ncbi:MAG: SPOR domain-containing protein [Ginsengibacter sp.]